MAELIPTEYNAFPSDAPIGSACQLLSGWHVLKSQLLHVVVPPQLNEAPLHAH